MYDHCCLWLLGRKHMHTFKVHDFDSNWIFSIGLDDDGVESKNVMTFDKQCCETNKEFPCFSFSTYYISKNCMQCNKNILIKQNDIMWLYRIWPDLNACIKTPCSSLDIKCKTWWYTWLKRELCGNNGRHNTIVEKEERVVGRESGVLQSNQNQSD